MTLQFFVTIFIATLFIVSSITKLRSPKAFQVMLEQLGLSKKITRFSMLFPVAELLVGLTLLWPPIRLWGQVSVLMLLIIFSWSAWKALSANNKVKCNCFGSLTDESFGLSTVLRIAVLIILDLYLLISHDATSLNSIHLIEIVDVILFSLGVMVFYSLIVISFETRILTFKQKGMFNPC